MSTSEGVRLLVGFGIMFVYPFVFLVLGHQWLLGAVALWGGLLFSGPSRRIPAHAA